MAYTPTTWVTGDTITATKLNKLEQGVANAGGGNGGTVFYEVTTTNFPSSSNAIGWFAYIKKSGNAYSPANMLSSIALPITVYGNQTGCWFSEVSIPTLEDYYLGFSLASGVTLTASTGGLSSTPIATPAGNIYLVTGDFTATFNGWA